MRTSTIYLSNRNYLPPTIDDEIAYRYSELRTCEQLMSMGYNYSCGSNLQKRADDLRNRISYLEDKKKRDGRKKSFDRA